MKSESTRYWLWRSAGVCVVLRDRIMLDHRLDLWRHSPTGLEWGYTGTGPAQTALAILADFLEDDERAVRLHQTFKFALIAPMPTEGGEITGVRIKEFLREAEMERVTGATG